MWTGAPGVAVTGAAATVQSRMAGEDVAREMGYGDEFEIGDQESRHMFNYDLPIWPDDRSTMRCPPALDNGITYGDDYTQPGSFAP